ncbi:MAG: 3-isopropylmalate dehydratase large subunit [Pseudomonadota bacterium]
MGNTIFDMLWRDHQVRALSDGSSLIYIDRVFLHERTGGIALKSLTDAGRAVRRPSSVFCTIDHIVDTFPGRGDDTRMPGGSAFITTTREMAQKAGINFFDIGDPRQGIVHVVSPEQGIALPGLTLVCPDSHTCTLGGLGAFAWGIGSTDGEHALATSTLRINRPKSMQIWLDGTLREGVGAKDIILALIGKYTAAGGSGYMLEFAGPAAQALPVEARLTLCNMAVEFSAFTGLIAPDDTVFEYVAGRPFAPKGAVFDAALSYWRTLQSAPDAHFDKRLELDVSQLSPQVTWGTSPAHVAGIDQPIPDPSQLAVDASTQTSLEKALNYMDLQPGSSVEGLPIGGAFIGSCTNSRLSDLRRAAAILKGRKVAEGVNAICVPGSSQVKAAAEAEGLHHVFQDAGFSWRESGCSMCFYAGGESFGHRQRVITSTNRNFESRQGPETRSHLASPETVAASAICGAITDPRKLTRGVVTRDAA